MENGKKQKSLHLIIMMFAGLHIHYNTLFIKNMEWFTIIFFCHIACRMQKGRIRKYFTMTFALLSYKFPVLHCKDDIIATVYFFKCAETENWHWRKGFFCVYGYRQIRGVFFKLRQRSFYLFAGGDNILIGK